jgi:iron complex transport system ATP-binding protein
MATEVIVDITKLRIQRGGVGILRGIDWRVRRGEHWAILGANGSGKTSLLSALTGYLMPTGGTISVLGKTFGKTDWRELRKRVGLVSSSIRQMMGDTEPALDTVASGKYAMIDFWGTPSKRDRTEAMRVLRDIECLYLKDRPWAVLSQGERQRVLIGRALMAKPALLILDEPCAGLDPVAREHFLQFLSRLAREPKAPTLVLVTHHVEEIVPAFSHALMLREGQAIAQGKRGEVMSSESLGIVFGAKVKLARGNRRYSLEVKTRSKSIM